MIGKIRMRRAGFCMGILLGMLGVFSSRAVAQSAFDLRRQAPDAGLSTPAANSELGYAFATGDLNADSKTDLVIGAPGVNDDGTPQDGSVYIFWGGRRLPALIDFVTNKADVEIAGHPVGSGAGTSLFCRDVNGDEIDDLIIGAPYADLNEVGTDVGLVEIFFGRADFPTRALLQAQAADVRIWGETDSDKLGRVITSGDFNGDTISDLLFAAPGASTGNGVSSGIVYLLLGQSFWDPVLNLGFDTRDIVRFAGKEANNVTATSLGVGNFNGDGFTDILIGAHKANFSQRVDCGETYLILGRNDLPPTLDLKEADRLFAGAKVRDFSGWAVAAADFNRDGRDEIVIGSPQASNGNLTSAGLAHFLDFSALAADTIDFSQPVDFFTIMGPHRASRLPANLLVANVNNDGTADLLLGIPADSSFSKLENAGALVMLYGRENFAGSLNLQTERPDLVIIGGETGSAIGNAFAAGDFDADGKTDIALKKNDGNAGNSVYLIYGSSLVTSVATRHEKQIVPEGFFLQTGYPNPFSRATKLVVEAPLPLALEVVIYDLSGRRVRALFAGQISAGRKALEWDGLNDAGKKLVAGVYFVRASATVAGRKIVRTSKLAYVGSSE